MISAFQIYVRLDYGKDSFKRICKGIRISKLLLCVGSDGYGDRPMRLFSSHQS